MIKPRSEDMISRYREAAKHLSEENNYAETAREFGLHHGNFHSWCRKNISNLPVFCKKSKNQNVDLGLAVMEVLAEPGVEYNLAEMAYVCDCSIENLSQALRKALKKCRIIFDGEKFDDYLGN